MNKNTVDIVDDFGFSLLDEEELKKAEALLALQLSQKDMTVDELVQTCAELENKIITARRMIEPLLNNLARDPEKKYLFWPNRAEKISSFKKKLDDFLEV